MHTSHYAYIFVVVFSRCSDDDDDDDDDADDDCLRSYFSSTNYSKIIRSLFLLFACLIVCLLSCVYI